MPNGRKRKSTSSGRGLSKKARAEVKGLMHETKEDKQASSNSGLIQHNSAIAVGDLLRLVPAITQGTAEGQRIGNEIMAKTLKVQGLLNVNYNGQRTRAKIGVRVFMFSVKGCADANSAIAQSATWINGMLRDGTNVRAFDGSVRSYFLPVNTDLITLHAERRCNMTFPFQLNTGIAPDATSFPVQTQFSYKYWKASIKCKNKKLKFSSQSAGGGIDTIPNNWGPLIAVGYCKLDGSAPDVLDTGVTSEISSQLYFEDA